MSKSTDTTARDRVNEDMKPAMQKLYDANIDDFGHLEPLQIMGLTVYGEARGENRAGRIAVATVILERVEHRDWDGKTIEDVCLWPYQFSCYLPKDPNRAKLLMIAKDWNYHVLIDKPLTDCFYIARGVFDGTIPGDQDIANAHACQYLTTAAKKSADWWQSMKLVKKIESHEFYA
jgi:hypothetical protein